jgi:hypothetical protein
LVTQFKTKLNPTHPQQTKNQKKEMGINASVDRALRIRDLEREVSSLKQDNDALRAELKLKLRQQLNQRSVEDKKQPSEISSAQIEMYVDKMMEDPKTNLGYVPDFMEKPLEVKTIAYLLNAIGHTVDSARMEFMGHEIVMRVQPVRPATDSVPKNIKKPEEGYSSFDDDAYDVPSPVKQVSPDGCSPSRLPPVFVEPVTTKHEKDTGKGKEEAKFDADAISL